MVYELSISKKQIEYIKAGISHFCANPNCIDIQRFDFVRINNINSKIVAEIIHAECFTCPIDLVNHKIFQDSISCNGVKNDIADEIYNLFTAHKEVCAFWLNRVYNDNKPLEIALYVITELLYWSILFFRNIPLTKKIFAWKLEKDTEKRLLFEINKVEKLLLVLKGKYDFEKCLNQFSLIHKDSACNSLKALSLIDLGKNYPLNVDSIINDTRMSLITEIENQIREIINDYQNKRFVSIREIGYKIHNIPEMIRNMHDWR